MASDKKYSWAELEEAVTKKMVEECKLDACFDLFLNDIKQRHDYKSLPDLATLSKEHEGNFKELQTRLNRLLPGYLDNNESKIIDDTRLQWKLKSRWRQVSHRFGDSDGPNSFHETLWNILMDQRYREQVLKDETDSSSSTHIARVEVCRQLKNLIDAQKSSTPFACGGSIPIRDPDATDDSDSVPRIFSVPVKIFWATSNDSNARKLVLPIDDSTSESSQSTLQKLVDDCPLATFGRGQKDVFDPEYRKAGKMEPSHFSTTFHPANFGIIENIEQRLLPSISTTTQNSLGFRKLTAELYKLNVYSGPSGLFRKHVDTPRSETQIGSLVVCLPARFKGGTFIVQHDGNSVEFDWSNASNSVIQWAAFYSDCEHEIKTVSEGERVTLTYNLYVTEPVGLNNSPDNGIVQAQSLPLYGWLRDVTDNEEFTEKGGVLGIYCSHSYPHSSGIARLQLPRGLKGLDLLLFSVFRSLGLEVDVLPVLEFGGRYGPGNRELENDCVVKCNKKRYMEVWEDFDELIGYLDTGELPEDIEYTEFLPQKVQSTIEVDRYWKLLFGSRRVKGITEASKDRDESGLYTSEGARVGTTRKEYFVTDKAQEEEGEGLDEASNSVWPAYYLPGIMWVNEPQHEEMAFTQLSYGNEASLDTRYSCAAILVAIPPLNQRKRKRDAAC